MAEDDEQTRQMIQATGRACAAPAAAGYAGKSWTEEEDQRLLAGFDAGTPVAALARTHERTTGAINSRWVKLGRLQASDKSLPA